MRKVIFYKTIFYLVIFLLIPGLCRGFVFTIIKGQGAAYHTLPATGQTTSNEPYLSDAVTDYPGAGDKEGGDGWYHKGAVLSYTVSTPVAGEDVVTDNNTGLMWVRDGTGAGCNNGATLAWKAAIAFCENLTFAGHSDWRLPNVKELMSIVDYSLYNPSIQQTDAFQNTQAYYYWSSTTYASNTSYAWGVLFYNGLVNYTGKTNTLYVRPVRGGQ